MLVLFEKVQAFLKQASAAGRTDLSRRFELVREIGKGAFSSVYVAREKQTRSLVSLKILQPGKTAVWENRFRSKGLAKPTEGEIALSLRHPHIVRTFEHGVSTKGEQFLIMEYVKGESLEFLLQTRSSKLTECRGEYLVQLASALEHCHQSYLHRDVCPRNVLIDRAGNIKLIDFGLAVPNQPEFRTRAFLAGTPGYLAPEIMLKKPFDRRIDLFSLGVMAYELYTGRLPWKKTPEFEVAADCLNRDGADPRKYRADLDQRVVAFLIKAIQRKPEHRFQTAAQFAEAVKALPPR